MDIHHFDPKQDREAVHRIWMETGWLDPKSGDGAAALDSLTETSRGLVARMDGEAECAVFCAPAHMRYLGEDIPYSGVMAVTTSRIGRKQGFAKRLTARSVAEEATDGALLSGLGMFDQGFYDLLGYGTGSYDHEVSIDPQKLTIPATKRTPKRLTLEDCKEIHASRAARKKEHGFVTFTQPEVTKRELIQTRNGFGLGFCDGPNGELTHHFWCGARNVDPGPYRVLWMAYQNGAQFLELMGLLKNLGDQVRIITLIEPPGIQLQDLIEQPLRTVGMSAGSKFSTRIRTLAIWQLRICDIPACLERTHLPCNEFQFNLALTDPIEPHLDDDLEWRGTGGDYIITLGPNSNAERKTNPKLKTLTTTINAFTRMWMGARPATGLATTDTLNAPPELLEQLDQAFRLPDLKQDWGF